MTSALHEIVKDFTAESKTFDVSMVIAELKHRTNIDDALVNLIWGAVRWELVRTFETGQMVGYHIATKFSVDAEDKMRSTLEFKASKPFDKSELTKKPEDPVRVSCMIERDKNAEINRLVEKYSVTKDILIRMLLLKALDKIEE